MILLVGLGNPGAKYAQNRHNAGFQVIRAIVEAHRLGPERSKFSGALADGRVGGTRVLTLRPETFYNESGNTIAAAARFHKIEPDQIIVFHDEIDLAPGKVRIKQGGGLAGNNGLKSTAAHLGPDFWRVRIGVGHPGRKDAVTPFVLGDFSKAEREEWFDPLCQRIADHLPSLLPPTEESANKFMSAVCNPQTREPEKKRAPATGAKPTEKNRDGQGSAPTSAPAPATPFAEALKDLKSRPDE